MLSYSTNSPRLPPLDSYNLVRVYTSPTVSILSHAANKRALTYSGMRTVEWSSYTAKEASNLSDQFTQDSNHH